MSRSGNNLTYGGRIYNFPTTSSSDGILFSDIRDDSRELSIAVGEESYNYARITAILVDNYDNANNANLDLDNPSDRLLYEIEENSDYLTRFESLNGNS